MNSILCNYNPNSPLSLVPKITTTKTGSLDVFKLSRDGSLDGFKNVVEASVKKGKVLDG